MPALFSQDKDSLAQVQEMQRLNRLGDSLHREQLKRDSEFAKTMEISHAISIEVWKKQSKKKWNRQLNR